MLGLYLAADGLRACQCRSCSPKVNHEVVENVREIDISCVSGLLKLLTTCYTVLLALNFLLLGCGVPEQQGVWVDSVHTQIFGHIQHLVHCLMDPGKL